MAGHHRDGSPAQRVQPRLHGPANWDGLVEAPLIGGKNGVTTDSPIGDDAWFAEKGESIADWRDEMAAEREAEADERDAIADEREYEADDREAAQDERERQLDASATQSLDVLPNNAWRRTLARVQRANARILREAAQQRRVEHKAERRMMDAMRRDAKKKRPRR